MLIELVKFFKVVITQNFFNIHIFTFIQTYILCLLYCFIIHFIGLRLYFISII